MRDAARLYTRFDVRLADDGRSPRRPTIAGEPIDRDRHVLDHEVKAVTRTRPQPGAGRRRLGGGGDPGYLRSGRSEPLDRQLVPGDEGSASVAVKIPAVVPTARTQLAPTALASFRHPISSSPESGRRCSRRRRRRRRRCRRRNRPDRRRASSRGSTPTGEIEPSLAPGDDDPAGPHSRKARAWRIGSDSPRISAASSVLGRKTSVMGQDRLESRQVVRRAGTGHVEHRDGPPARAFANRSARAWGSRPGRIRKPPT